MRKLTVLATVIALIVSIQGATMFGAGSNVSTPRPRVTNLTESAATSYVDVFVVSGQVAGGAIQWTIEANDGTDYQVRSGSTYFAAVNKAGTVTCSVGDVGTTVAAVSAGTLTNTMTCVAGAAGTNKMTIQANAVSSLTQTTLKIKYFVTTVPTSASAGL